MHSRNTLNYKGNSLFSQFTAIIGFFCISTFLTSVLHAQTWNYNEITENGDTIVHTFPPPDSTYLHDRLILKFHN